MVLVQALLTLHSPRDLGPGYQGNEHVNAPHQLKMTRMILQSHKNKYANMNVEDKVNLTPNLNDGATRNTQTQWEHLKRTLI